MRTVSNGPSRIDSFFLGELHVDLLNADASMRVTVGYQDSKTQRRLGSTHKMTGWSAETMQKLRELLEAVENDVAADLFDGTPNPSGAEGITTTSDGVPQL